MFRGTRTPASPQKKSTACTRFLGLTINCTLTWINNIDLLTKNLSSTCFLFQNIKPYVSFSAYKMIYNSLFHSVMSYGIMFWGNSPHSPIIFKIQERVIRTLMGCGYRKSCRAGVFNAWPVGHMWPAEPFAVARRPF
jgi:hypothetical protein